MWPLKNKVFGKGKTCLIHYTRSMIQRSGCNKIRWERRRNNTFKRGNKRCLASSPSWKKDDLILRSARRKLESRRSPWRKNETSSLSLMTAWLRRFILLSENASDSRLAKDRCLFSLRRSTRPFKTGSMNLRLNN